MKNMTKLSGFCVLILSTISYVSCKQEDPIEIGINKYGGIGYYVDVTGQHGLVCAPSNQTEAEWGCYLTKIIGADGYAVGTGNQNTVDIVNDCPDDGTAAKICYDLVLSGYDDWYLPSIGELSLMYTYLKTNGLGGFVNDAYWSSTQSDFNEAYMMDFFDGSLTSINKDITYRVRAIRAF